MAQRITRSATNREIAGSNPVMDKNSFLDFEIFFIFISKSELLPSEILIRKLEIELTFYQGRNRSLVLLQRL